MKKIFKITSLLSLAFAVITAIVVGAFKYVELNSQYGLGVPPIYPAIFLALIVFASVFVISFIVVFIITFCIKRRKNKMEKDKIIKEKG